MSLGNKLTWYLLIGVVAVMGLDLYLNLQRTQANLLNDLHREVAAISRTLRVSLEQAGDDAPERYFAHLAAGISGFENILGIVFYDREARIAATSTLLQDRRLPEVDVRQVITTQTPVEGLFSAHGVQRYYRVEPISGSDGEGIAAFLVLEDFPVFTREFRGRVLQTLLTTLVLLVVLAGIVSVVIRRNVTVPLRTFARRIEAIGQGHFDQRLQMARNDEIGQLAREFDRMCAHVEEAQSRLVAEGEDKLRLERALRHSEKLAALGQLASRLAHEIGTPLNIMQGRAEQLLQRGTVAEEVAVTDTGPGIPPNDLLHVFEPFFTTKGQNGGTGLGLAISREIVRSHHGELRIESVPGQGSRFIVSLPVAETEQDRAA